MASFPAWLGCLLFQAVDGAGDEDDVFEVSTPVTPVAAHKKLHHRISTSSHESKEHRERVVLQSTYSQVHT